MRASSQVAGSARIGFGFLETILIGNVSTRPPQQDRHGAESGDTGNDIEDQERVHGYLDALSRSDDSAAIKSGNDVRRRLVACQLAEREQFVRLAGHHENSDVAIQTS
ncbi:hypothetical protein [Burkholderia cenocepacia]|uniref:hypothetical protein n=1 Tax=Burkholderia cenocepacia TaxID=95486 RepID=UPI000A61F17A|nr:hypothetical protein [Burkholderia cenocepacia]